MSWTRTPNHRKRLAFEYHGLPIGLSYCSKGDSLESPLCALAFSCRDNFSLDLKTLSTTVFSSSCKIFLSVFVRKFKFSIKANQFDQKDYKIQKETFACPNFTSVKIFEKYFISFPKFRGENLHESD